MTTEIETTQRYIHHCPCGAATVFTWQRRSDHPEDREMLRVAEPGRDHTAGPCEEGQRIGLADLGNQPWVEPIVEVPENFDFDEHHPSGSTVFLRYQAGIYSILDRADLAVSWSVERVQARHYQDEDLEIRFQAGDLVAEGSCNAIDKRCATVTGVIAWHRTGGNNLTAEPLYVEEQATIRVLSRTGTDETTFAVRPAELAKIKNRVRGVILRDHLVGLTREANAWRWGE